MFLASIVFSVLFMCINGTLTEIGRVWLPSIDFTLGTGSESVAVATSVNKMFTADGGQVGLNVISFASTDGFTTSAGTSMTVDTGSPILFTASNVGIAAGDVSSVTYLPSKDLIVAALVPTNYAEVNGWLAFVNPDDLSIFVSIPLPGCFLPDHVTYSRGGDLVVVSCEGEADDNEIANPTHHPPGSIQLINVKHSFSSHWTDTNIGFEDFDDGGSKNGLLPNDIYLPYQNEAFSVNVEPEYASCTDDNLWCYISLQEQNAVAILNVPEESIEKIFTLGYRDFSEFGLDASNKDDGINIVTYERLYGLRMPDSINYFQSTNNRHYVFTANEGDSKEFDENRVKDLILDDTISGFDGDAAQLQLKENLGQLKVLNLLGRVDETVDPPLATYNELYAFSSRDFTVFEIEFYNVPGQGQQISTNFVFSSNSDFEEKTAVILGTDGFNSNYDYDSFDKRSDDKGPEPEAVITGSCSNGNSFAFIAMERVGGIFVYDITNIDTVDANGNRDITYKEYITNRDFSVPFAEDTRPPSAAGDIGPEQLRFIDENTVGNTVPLLVVANSESSSVTVYKVDCT